MVGKKGRFWKISKNIIFFKTSSRFRKGVEGLGVRYLTYSVSILTYRVRNLTSIEVEAKTTLFRKIFKNPKWFIFFRIERKRAGGLSRACN